MTDGSFQSFVGKEMKQTSVIVAFLLCWSAVSPIPHHKTSNSKSVNEVDYVIEHNDDNANLGKESTDEASSGKDWGGNIIQNILNFLYQKESNNVENDEAHNKLFLDPLISRGKKFVKDAAGTIAGIGDSIKTFLSSLTSGNKLFDNDSQRKHNNENVTTWIQKNIQNLGKLFTISDTEAVIGEESRKHDRTKRDVAASSSALPWTKAHMGGISQHVLKLSQGSPSNVLKSEKATVAEALNGRAAIGKILARAKAKAAQAAQHNNLFDFNNDISKWLLSGLSFDTNIFRHHQRRLPSYDTKMSGHSETETSNNGDDDDDSHTFVVSRHVSEKPNRHRHDEVEHTFTTLSDSTIGAADTGRYSQLRHKSEHRKHLSPELEIIWGGKRGHETDGMLHTSQHQMHTSREEAESNGLRYVPSHARAPPHPRFRVTEDERIENGIPEWKHAEWIRALHSANSLEFDSSDEREDYMKRYIFETLFHPDLEFDEAEDEPEYAKHRKWHEISPEINIHEWINTGNEETIGIPNSRERAKLGRNRYRYGFGNRKYPAYNKDTISFDDVKNQQHLTDSLELERASSIDSGREGSENGDENKHLNADGVERSAIWSGTSAEITGGAEKKQSGNMLITKISTDTPTRKPVNIDIEHYRTGDQSVAANSATSFSSSLSDEKGSRHTNNVPTSPSVDDGSVVVETKTENDRAALGRSRAVIDNDATSAEIEMGFSEIKDHPPTDSPSAHSSVSRARSKTHLENRRVHHGEYQRSATETAASSGVKSLAKNQNETSDAKDDPKEVTENTVSSMEDAASTKSEHQRDSFAIDSREENYVKIRKEHANPRRTAARHRTSIEVIDINDRSAEVLLPKFPVLEFGKKRASSDIGYQDAADDRETHDADEIEIDTFAKDLRSDVVDHDDLDKEEGSVADIETSEDSKLILSHDRQNKQERRKNRKHIVRHNYRNKFNHRKDHNEHSQRNTHNQRSQQLNQHAFNQHTRDMTTSSVAWNATRFATWEEYLYFIWEQERKSNASNVSLESSTSTVSRNKERNNVTDGKISSSDGRGKKYMTDGDNHVYLKKHESVPDPTAAHSTGINGIITSTQQRGEEKTKDTSDRSENHTVVAHMEDLRSYDNSAVDTISQAANTITIDSNIHRQDGLWEFLNNSRVDVETESERIYGARGGNKNTDVIATQTAETAQSTDSKSNLQRVSSETSPSESDSTKKLVAAEQNERVLSADATTRYQHHNDSRETSASSASIAQSQVKMKHHSDQRSRNRNEISTSAETVEATSSDAMNKLESNIQNAVAFSNSSAESRFGFLGYEDNATDNKNYDKNAKVSADATVFVDIKDKQILGDISFPNSSAKSEEKIKNYSNHLTSTEVSTTNPEDSLRTIGESSVESLSKSQWNSSKNVQTNTDMEISSAAAFTDIKNQDQILSSDMSETDLANYLANRMNNEANTISKVSTKEIVSSAAKDQQESHLQKSISSSAEYFQNGILQTETEQNSDNSQDSQTNIFVAKSIDAPSKTKATSSKTVEKDYQQQASSLPFSSSGQNKPSTLITLSGDITAIDQHLLHTSSSQVTNINDLHIRGNNSPGNVNPAMLKISHINYDNHRKEQKNNKLHPKWLNSINKENVKFADDKNIEQHKFVEQDTENALSAAASAKTVASTNIKSTRSSATSSSSIDAAIETWTRSEHDLDPTKEERLVMDNSVTSEALNKHKNNYNNEWLKTSSISLLHNTSEGRDKYRDSAENYGESITMEASSESMLSRDERQSRDHLMEQTASPKSFEEAQEERQNFDVSKGKSKVAPNTIAEMSNRVNNIHQEKLRNGPVIWKERLQANNEVDDKNERTTVKYSQENVVDSREQIKDLIRLDNADKEIDVKYDNRNDILKTTSSNNLDAVTLQTNEPKLHVLSNTKINNIAHSSREIEKNNENNLQRTAVLDNLHDEISAGSEKNYGISKTAAAFESNKKSTENIFNGIHEKYENMKNISEKNVKNNVDTLISTDIINSDITDDYQHNSLTTSIDNVQNKAGHKSTSSVDMKTQLDVDPKSNISLEMKAITSTVIRNNINKWDAKFQRRSSSSLLGELQNGEQTAVKTGISRESIDNIINEGAHEDDSLEGTSRLESLKITRADNDHNRGDQRADVENIARAKAGTSSSNVPAIEHQNDNAKETTSMVLHSKQQDLNAQKEDKAITSNILLSSESIDSNETHNARRELLDAASTNSHTEIQGGSISDITNKNQKITANAATSVGKVTGKSQEKLITSWSESNSFTNSQIGENNDSNTSQEEARRASASARTSANSAVSNNHENTRQNELVEKNYTHIDFDRDAYTEDKNRIVPKNNIANDANATASEADSDVTDEHPSGVTARAEHEYNSSLQRKSTGMIRFRDAKDRVTESKNTLNNVEESLKTATQTTASADVTSSTGVENMSIQDASKMLSSSDSYIESEIYNTRFQHVSQNSQESMDSWVSTSSGSADQNLKNRKLTRIENGNDQTENLYNNDNNAAILKQTTDFSNVKNESNLSKETSSIGLFADAQQIQQNAHESNGFKRQRLITGDSTALSDSRISQTLSHKDIIHGNNLKESMSSNNSHAKSIDQYDNHVHFLQADRTNTLSNESADTISNKIIKDPEEEKHSRHTALFDSSPKRRLKNENLNSMNKDWDSDIIGNTETKWVSSTNAKATDSHIVNSLINTAGNMKVKNKRIFGKNVMTEDLMKQSTNLFSTTHDTEMLEDGYENSANIKTESNLLHDWQNGLRREEILPNIIRNSERDITPISSTNSHAITQLASQDIGKSKNAEKNREKIVKSSILNEVEARRSKVKEADSQNWLVTSDVATLAEERTQNKDNFNTLREAEQVATYAETSAGTAAGMSSSIESEQRDIRVEDLSQYLDGRDAAKNILDVISGASDEAASKETRNRSENKSTWANRTMATSSLYDAHAKGQTIDEERSSGVSHGSKFLVNNEETRHSNVIEHSSSASASNSGNVNVHFGRRHNQINDETSTINTASKTVEEEKQRSLIETSLHSAQKNACAGNVETREFISAASSLYKMLDERQDSEVLLMMRNPTGIVQVASLKKSVEPHVGYRLISREVYEKIRTIIANKQTLCIDCPLSST